MMNEDPTVSTELEMSNRVMSSNCVLDTVPSILHILAPLMFTTSL